MMWRVERGGSTCRRDKAVEVRDGGVVDDCVGDHDGGVVGSIGAGDVEEGNK